MFNRKKKEQPEQANFTAKTVETPMWSKPSLVEILKKKRAEKMELVKRLDREIEMLDHDITFVERHPANARILEFIASRFSEEAGWNMPYHDTIAGDPREKERSYS